MTLKTPAEQAVTDLAVLFSTDLPGVPTVSYNGSDIAVIDEGSGTEEDGNSVFDFMDVRVQSSDVPTVTYRTDTLVHGGLTWRYPKVIGLDVYTTKIRWIRNQRPKAR